MEPHADETPLDKLSCRALEAIQAGRFQRAEHLCKKLLRLYRKAPDGHERMGMLRMAQKRYEDALHHFDKLLQMAQKEPQYFGPEAEKYIAELRTQALAEIATAAGDVTNEEGDAAATPSPDAAPQPGRVATITAGIVRLFRAR